MGSKFTRLQELDDELKKLQQEAEEKRIDENEYNIRVAKIRTEIKAITLELRTEPKNEKGS